MRVFTGILGVVRRSLSFPSSLLITSSVSVFYRLISLAGGFPVKGEGERGYVCGRGCGERESGGVLFEMMLWESKGRVGRMRGSAEVKEEREREGECCRCERVFVGGKER